jgi:hypothetical protein
LWGLEAKKFLESILPYIIGNYKKQQIMKALFLDAKYIKHRKLN